MSRRTRSILAGLGLAALLTGGTRRLRVGDRRRDADAGLLG